MIAAKTEKEKRKQKGVNQSSDESVQSETSNFQIIDYPDSDNEK